MELSALQSMMAVQEEELQVQAADVESLTRNIQIKEDLIKVSQLFKDHWKYLQLRIGIYTHLDALSPLASAYFLDTLLGSRDIAVFSLTCTRVAVTLFRIHHYLHMTYQYPT